MQYQQKYSMWYCILVYTYCTVWYDISKFKNTNANKIVENKIKTMLKRRNERKRQIEYTFYYRNGNRYMSLSQNSIQQDKKEV